MSDVDLGVQLELNLQQWNQNIDKAIRGADDLDDFLGLVIKRANDLEKALNTALGGAGGSLKFTIDVDDSALMEAIDLQKMLQVNTQFVAGVDESQLENADALKTDLAEDVSFDVAVDTTEFSTVVQEKAGLEENVNFAVSVSDAELQAAYRAYEDLSQSLTTTVNVSDDELTEAKRKHDDLGDSVTTTVNADDSELDTAKDKKDDLDGSVTTKVNVDGAEVTILLQQIRDMQTVNIAFNVGGAGADFLKGLTDVSVGGIFEMNDALIKLEGTTGRMIPGAKELIEDLYTNAWGDSRTEIAQVITLGSQLGISQENLADAITSAYEVASVTGEDVNKVLRTQDNMVKTGITPTYRDAADALTTGFQNGANRAEDLFDTLTEYSSTFSDLGLDAEKTTAILNEGLDAGAMNTDLVADALREFGILAKEVGGTAENFYEKMGLKDMLQGFRDGKVSGEELLNAVFDKMALMNPAERATAGLELFGTQSEDLGVDVIMALKPADAAFENVGTNASTAAGKVNSTLGTAFTELKRTIEVEFGGLLEDTLDIDGLIEKLRNAVQVFVDEIQGGEGILGAAEIALEMPGLEDTLQQIQQVFSEIGIGILQAMSSVMDAIGQDGAAGAIDSIVSEMARVQIGADIFAADEQDDLAFAVMRALDRGVSEADVTKEMGDHIDGLIAGGKFQEAFDALVAANEGALNSSMEGFIFPDAAFGEIRTKIYTAGAKGFEDLIAEGSLLEAYEVGEFAPGGLEAAQQQLYTALYDGIDRGLKDTEQRLEAFQLAEKLLGGEGEETVIAGFGSMGEELTNALLEDINNAIVAGDFDLATRIAETMNSETLQGQIDAIRGQFEQVQEATKTTMTDSGQSTEGFAQDVQTTAGEINTQTEAIKLSVGTVSTATDEAKKGIGESTDQITTDFDELSTGTEEAADKTKTSITEIGKTTGDTADKVSDNAIDIGDKLGSIADSSGLMADDVIADLYRVSDAFMISGNDIDATNQLIAAGLDGLGNYVVTWQETVSDNFLAVQTAFANMAADIGNQASGLSATLGKVGGDIQTLSDDLGGTLNQSGGGNDSGSGDSGTTNGMMRTDPNYRGKLSWSEAVKKATADEGYWEKDSEGNRALVLYADRERGYYKEDRATKEYTFVKSDEFSQVFSGGTGSSNDIFGGGGASGSSTPTRSAASSAGSASSAGQLNQLTRQLNTALDQATRYYADFVKSFDKQSVDLVASLDRITLSAELLGGASTMLNSNTTNISNNVIFNNQNAAASANSAVNASTALRGFGG